MALITICDICGRPLSRTEDCSQYKVKKLRSNWDQRWWSTIDVHDRCVRELLKAKGIDMEDEPFMKE